MKPKIFILIPVYNVEKYLDECLVSILKQSYRNYEVILVDDGSTDSSGIICDQYAQKHNHVTVIHQPNSGLLAARNTAKEFIRQNRMWESTYCIFVDSDDALKENALEIISQNIETSCCDMLIYGYERFGEKGVDYTTDEECQEPCLIVDRAELFRKALIQHTYNSMCRKAIRTQLLFVGDFESVMHVQMGEDLIQSAQLFLQCNTVKVISDILYRYRMNEGSITHSVKIKKYTDDLSSREFAVQLIFKENIWNEDDFSAYRNKCLGAVLNHIKQILANSSDKQIGIAHLKTIREHSFFVAFCQKGIAEQSHLLLRLFKNDHLTLIWRLWQINKLKNKILRR